MDAQSQKQAEALAALSAADRTRLEHLAALGGTTPEQLWPDVWRYGFDDVEEGVYADIQADKDIAEGITVPNSEVMAELQRMLDDHAERKLQAG